MSALLIALIIGRPCAYSLERFFWLDLDDVSPATESLELFHVILAYLLVETLDVNTPSILEVWNQLTVISLPSYSPPSEGKTNLDSIL